MIREVIANRLGVEYKDDKQLVEAIATALRAAEQRGAERAPAVELERLLAERAQSVGMAHAHEHGETKHTCGVCKRWRYVDEAIERIRALPLTAPATTMEE